MINLDEIEIDLQGLRRSRNEELPIAGWRSKALCLFTKLCNNGEETSSFETLKTLSRRLAIECLAELDRYFNVFGYMDEGEKRKWQGLSNQLRMIYSP